ncbi:hypothetical protein EJ377_01180 [Chryseobacterium arthrosphaerae]|uniref:GEVED domain-containing protein n=1 Tax=Chryseobacterium arthrosphaerae TaxID=651561 RepID=A0A3S0Q6Z4_9FLAO|nr:hypothetical protein EJ377_01180 [Chryseobacterium arthrosphaerae]
MGTSGDPGAINVGGRLYIRSNGSGFSFGVLRGTGGTPVYESTIRPFNTNMMVVLKYEAVAGATNDAIKLYVNPSLSSEPAVADVQYSAAIGTDVGALSGIALLQGTVANAPILEVDGINVGASWNSVTSAVYDYGDLPTSYDFTKDGVYAPAAHSLLSGLGLGNIVPDLELSPQSVAVGANNNGSNGDGLDENAIVISVNQIRTGVPYTLSVPVTNSVATTKYLYGWIDFNNDGLFQVGEVAITTFSATGSTTQTLSWTGAQTGTIVSGSPKLYMRLRLSDRSLNDFTTVASGGVLIDERSVGTGTVSTANASDFGATSNGEVEDYQIDVVNTFDYGDLPSSFENDKDGNVLPALHAPLTGFSIGGLLDVESTPASVTSSSENNTSGDNAVGQADEDGLSTLTSVSRGVAYSITVPVNIPSSLAGTKYLYGWIDLNGDGRFQVGEVASITTSATAAANLTLTWSAAQTATLVSGTTKAYLRLRLSNLSLTDFTTAVSGGALIDERSVGNGATSTVSAVNNPNAEFGEIEDYQLPVDLYDLGDAPASYETNNTNVLNPARQIASPLYFIGNIVDEEQAAQSVAAGNDNNGTNGDGVDEDGLLGTLPVIVKATSFNFIVPVSVYGISNAIAWVDFNNNGKFEASEAAYTSATTTTTGYQSVPFGSSFVSFWFRGSQTALIPNGTNNVNVRIRLTQTAGADNTATTSIDERSIGDGSSTGIYTIPTNGEVEDYRFVVNSNYDFGDTPESYEMDKDGLVNPANFKPARNFSTSDLHLGRTYDLESSRSLVATGSDNNGTNGDGADEDAISTDQLFIKPATVNTYTVALIIQQGRQRLYMHG